MLVRIAPLWIAGTLAACVGADLREGSDAYLEDPQDEARDRSVFDVRIDPAQCRGGQGPKLYRGGKATWTLMVYEAVDNNLQPYGEQDMEDMRAGHDGQGSVNVVLQFDRATPDGMTRYEVTADDSGELAPIESSPEEPDSGSALTLAQFGAWAAVCYPASNYMMIVGGHGGGYSRQPVKAAEEARARAAAGKPVVRLIAPDDRNNTEMLVPDLAKALRTVRTHVERQGGVLRMYGSDACLMQTMETISALRNTAEIIIGSEELEPGAGWPYNTILRDWTTRPDVYAADPAALAAKMVDYWRASYSSRGQQGFELENTLAAVRVDHVDLGGQTIDPITRARHRLREIAGAMVALLDKDPTFAGQVWAAADASPRFGDVNVDLGAFLVELHQRLTAARRMPRQGEHLNTQRVTRPEEYRTLRDAIEDLVGPVQLATAGPHHPAGLWPALVAASTAGEAYPNAMGISIYLPMEQCDWSLTLDTYNQSAFSVNSQWGQMVEKLLTRFPHPPVARYHGTGTMTLRSGGGQWQIPIACNTTGERFDIASDFPEAEEGAEEQESTERKLELALRGSMERGVWLVQAAELYGENPSIDARYWTRLSRQPLTITGAADPTHPDAWQATLEVPSVRNREAPHDMVTATATFSCGNWEATTYCDAVGAPPGF